VLGNRVLKQWFEQGSTFRIGNTSVDHSSAENVDDHIQVKIGPFFRTHQLFYVPGPDLVWTFSEQLGFLVDRDDAAGGDIP
jgi:hypothetical protein